LLGMIERLDKQHRKNERHSGGAVELPEYPRGGLLSVYRALYPKYLTAEHLRPLRDVFDRAKQGEPVKACVSFPRRAGKTEMVIAGAVDRLVYQPDARICYATYSGALSRKKSAKIRKCAVQMGVPIDPATRSKADWATGIGDGGLWATSTGGAITGMGFNLMCFDDMLEGRFQAESVQERDRAWNFITVDASPCCEPDAARLINGTRWHVDDPIGRAVLEGWEEINVPALDAAGNSYWPKRWTTTRLLQTQLELGGPEGYDWCAVYMGQPRSPGEKIFRAPAMIDALPNGPVRVGIGVDFAYTTKKSSDYSCAVVMAEIYGCYYVIDVYREKVAEDVFRAKVAELANLYKAQFVVGYVAKTEEANVTLLQRDGIAAFSQRAQQDKKTHALPCAAGWNIGKVRVLGGRVWTTPFLREVEWFTGSDVRDDQVDALCTVYDALYSAAPIDWAAVALAQQSAPQAMPWIQN
jgi:predicted phage terminase large subunit-like protein